MIGEVDDTIDAAKVKRVLACSGKVYYDLVTPAASVAPTTSPSSVSSSCIRSLTRPSKPNCAKYPKATEVIWVQDEPQNQGPWFYIQHHVCENMTEGQKLGYAGRAASASPAVGYLAKHQEQQKA